MASPTRLTSGIWAGPTGLITEAPIRQISIPIDFSQGTTATNTSFTFPANAIVWPVVVLFVRALEATGTTKTIDVGISGGSGQEIAKEISVASNGLVKATVSKTGPTLGDTFTVDSGVGADVATGAEISVVLGGATVNWTPGSADFAELKADIHLFYQEARSQVRSS